MKKVTICIGFVAATALVTALAIMGPLAKTADAFPTYSVDRNTGNCADCHGNYQTTNYVPNAASRQRIVWPAGLHNSHRNAVPNNFLNSNCNACHGGIDPNTGLVITARFPVALGSSVGAAPFNLACSGCHSGPGTRNHHELLVGAGTCSSCHGVEPVGNEKTPPPPVFTAALGTTSGTVRINNPCNDGAPGTVFEGSFFDVLTVGLDNDGDGLYDQNDPDCVAVVDPCAGVTCNDNNACTTDTCNSATGACSNTPITCNDNDICTTDTCNPASGCVYTATVPALCNDNSACTTDGCTANTCANVAITCSDALACTTDTCDSATGCVFTPVTCQTGQICDPATGNCVAINLCAGITCSDNNNCTTDSCDPATGSCVFTPAVCNDNNPCTSDACDTATGTCVFTAIICNDSNACTTDTCDQVTGCVFTPVAACNDTNPCTTDTCAPATGCVFTPVTCQAGQTCDPTTGNCVATNLCAGVTCNDNNACTADSCDPATGACVFTATVCNDNNACTTDACDTATGNCVFTAITCNDGNPCTADACDTATGGCVNNALTCTDNNLCTTDTCDSATGCVYAPVTCSAGLTCDPASGNCVSSNLCADVVCNDNNACTIDTCDPATGTCMFTAIACNDTNACTTDSCDQQTGTCVFTIITCNDGNLCTNDTCDAATGCVYTPVSCPAGQTCDTATGNCVSNDLCAGVTCNDNNACTGDACDPATGGCVFTPVVCNDGTACTTDACDPATGCVFTPLVCNDENLCTNDACDPTTGCVYTPVVCNDGNICTDDACVNGSCVYTNNSAACNDGNACTNGDVCSGGVCAGTAITCTDNNACTTDTCDPATGCVYTTIPGCGTAGSDVGILQFLVPSKTKDCSKAVPIIIVAKNFGNTTVTGTITLYKDGKPVKTWSDVKFRKRSAVPKLYFYKPSGDAGDTIHWKVVIDVPNDPNLSNNTSEKTTTVADCESWGHDHDSDHDHGHDRWKHR